MLPPAPMLATKNLPRWGAIGFFALALFIAGCTPSGPRALLKGKKLLERGDYTAAVAQFKTATSLLATNAQAWNYLGVACQYPGQPADAVTAYQRALTLDRDLMEAHYNLGCLWLEQNKPDAAKTEFTAYTLRRNTTPEGWLKLGAAQFHPDYAPAILNLATVDAQYLHDDVPALENYRKYLALTPRPADWDAV